MIEKGVEGSGRVVVLGDALNVPVRAERNRENT